MSASSPNASLVKNWPRESPSDGYRPVSKYSSNRWWSTPSAARQLLGLGAVQRLGRLQRLAPAEPEQEPAVDGVLVALGVSAEVVMVVEQQDRLAGVLPPVEPGRREAADAGTDHHHVDVVAVVESVDVESLAVTKRVRDLERPGVAPPQAGGRRRIGGAIDELLPRNQTGPLCGSQPTRFGSGARCGPAGRGGVASAERAVRNGPVGGTDG
jgi:hypothetical protein